MSPDNIDTNTHGEIVICEDPNYNLATELGLSRDTSLWVYDVNNRRLRRIAELDRQSAYAHAIAADPGNANSTIGTPGGWEFSGVIDAEPWLGRGSWIVNVQAHSLRIAPTAEPSKAVRSFTSSGSLWRRRAIGSHHSLACQP